MSKAVYDTRFFSALYYSKDERLLQRIKEEKRRQEKFISTVVIHEVYRLSLQREGRETAMLRIALLKQDFKVIPVTAEIAEISAELRQKHQLSMGDSMIAATASSLKALCVTDDPHFNRIKEIKTTWI
ncbi:PIN domain-containing protein [Candidatus Bathyarchaeota archaeon]|jgi:predicted nucleic acid-binding protein|nr:PIN domain-containing protein [Candidatus Bathyarchaeota archaeon]